MGRLFSLVMMYDHVTVDVDLFLFHELAELRKSRCCVLRGGHCREMAMDSDKTGRNC